MRNLLTSMFAIALAVSASAEEFFLVDASGTKHGPYEFSEGKVLDLEGRLFGISVVDPMAHEIMQKMKRIIIPEVEFRAANVHDVFDFLGEQSVVFDRDEDRRRISFVLKLGSRSARSAVGNEVADPFAAPDDPFAASDNPDDPFAAPAAKPALRIAKKPSGANSVPLVTFRATSISLHEVVNIVCEVCDLQWEVKDGVVVVTPKVKKKAEEEPIRKVTSPRPSPQVLMKRYTVEEGDDLFAIAMMWGVSVSKLRAANALTSKDKLKVGQKILIPLSE